MVDDDGDRGGGNGRGDERNPGWAGGARGCCVLTMGRKKHAIDHEQERKPRAPMFLCRVRGGVECVASAARAGVNALEFLVFLLASGGEDS